MPEKKRHHFVPKFYLKRFSKDEKSINIFNIKHKRIILNGSLKAQFFRDYLYGKEPEFENILGSLEGIAAKIFRKISDTAFFPKKDSQEWFNLLLFIVVQNSRTVASIDDKDEMMDKFLKRVMSNEPKFSQYNPDKFKIRMKNSSQMSVSFGAMVMPLATDLSLKILVSPVMNAFFISDNPIVYYNRLLEDDSPHSHCGIASKGLMIFLPITPKVSLCLYDKDVYNVGSSGQHRLLVMKSEDVDQLNGLQYVSASENIYFLGDFPKYIPDKMGKFRRLERTRMDVFGQESDGTSTSELIATSHQDIRIGLSLFFVRLKKSAKDFLKDYTAQESRPVFIARNPALLEGHQIFMEQVEKERRKYESSQPRETDEI